ncbi:hypothetical protein ES703_14669 [subsurface metagenome]
MYQSSVISRTEVKPKLAAFSTLPDFDDTQLKISQPDRPVKTIQDSNLQKTGLGARAGPGLRLDIIVTPKHSRTCGKWILSV